MKILAQKSFNPLSFSSCLVYGENAGKVTEYLQKIIKSRSFNLNDPFSSTILSFQDIIKSPNTLLDKINTPAFDGKVRLIYITDVDVALPANSQDVFEKIDNNLTYVLLASYRLLPAKSTTRIYFEKSKWCGVIACYNDEKEAAKHLIKKFFTENEIAIKPDLITFMSSYLRGERKYIYSELEKFSTYLGATKSITEKEVSFFFTEDILANLEDTVFAFAGKDIAKFLSLLAKEKNTLMIVKSLAKYFIRLYQVLVMIEEGSDIQSALDQLKPPVFFKYLEYFKCHLRLWQVEEIVMLLNKVLKIEISYKKGEAMSRMMLKNLSLTIV